MNNIALAPGSASSRLPQISFFTTERQQVEEGQWFNANVSNKKSESELLAQKTKGKTQNNSHNLTIAVEEEEKILHHCSVELEFQMAMNLVQLQLPTAFVHTIPFFCCTSAPQPERKDASKKNITQYRSQNQIGNVTDLRINLSVSSATSLC
ncbi:hypothetical protein V6N13_060776 [Hibiscus sabdariffa]